MQTFSQRLTDAIRRCGNPVVVGLDPRFDQLPPAFHTVDASDPTAVAGAYSRFCREIIDVVASLVPAVKPQMAFFEALGPAGMTALAEVVRHAREKNLLVILDGKRNDIGSTAKAYADAYLGENSVWGADALTVSPYLGDDSLTPFVEVAEQRNAGLFILVKTSNPGGKTFQDQMIDAAPLYQLVGELVDQLSFDVPEGSVDYSSVGAVVGATYPEQLGELRQRMPRTWFLVPGFGAQGGTAASVRDAFDRNGLGAIINNSRGIIFAHARPEYAAIAQSSWLAATDRATRDMIDQLRADTPVGSLTLGESSEN